MGRVYTSLLSDVDKVKFNSFAHRLNTSLKECLYEGKQSKNLQNRNHALVWKPQADFFEELYP